jgi:hypothetical protein
MICLCNKLAWGWAEPDVAPNEPHTSHPALLLMFF